MRTIVFIGTLVVYFMAVGFSLSLIRLMFNCKPKPVPDLEVLRIKQLFQHLIDASEFCGADQHALQFSFRMSDYSEISEILCVPKGMAPKLSTLCSMYIDLGMPTEILPITKDIFNKRFCVTAMKPGWNNGKRVTKFEGYINRSDSDAAKEKEHGL